MRFYLVDDDPDILALVRAVLEQAGHSVETCGSSAQALKEIPGRRPDCVITDVMMPVMDGFEFLDLFHGTAEWRDIPVVVLTAKQLTAAEHDRLLGRTRQIVAKGATPAVDVAAVVREAVRRRAGQAAAAAAS